MREGLVEGPELHQLVRQYLAVLFQLLKLLQPVLRLLHDLPENRRVEHHVARAEQRGCRSRYGGTSKCDGDRRGRKMVTPSHSMQPPSRVPTGAGWGRPPRAGP